MAKRNRIPFLFLFVQIVHLLIEIDHRHDYLPFGEELFAGTGGRTTTQGYAGDSVRQKFTLKERDNETGLDYFGARYFSSTQGRFTGADNPGFSRGTDPQTWNLYAYTANNPLGRLDPNGRDWFQIGEGYGARFEWYKGKKHTYTDADGNKQTAKNVGTHLLVFEFSGTRNSDGAAVGTLTLYNQNKVAAQNTAAFTGGRRSDGSQMNDIPLGVFTIRTDIRERASDQSALKPDNPRELKQIYGLQEIDRSLGFADPWGSKRAALNEWDTTQNSWPQLRPWSDGVGEAPPEGHAGLQSARVPLGAFLSPLWKAEKAKSTLQATSVTYYTFKDRCARRTGPLV